MIHHLILNILLVLLFLGCSSPMKKEHELNCILHSVVKIKSSDEIIFKREDVISNGYEYHFVIYDNGTMMVNDKDRYKKETNNTNAYSLLLNEHIMHDMQFKFTKTFDGVVFNLNNRGEQYTYDCVTVNQK